MNKSNILNQTTPQKTEFQRFTPSHITLFSGWLLFYASWLYFVVGFKPEHTFFLFFTFIVYFGTATSRKFLYAFFILLLYGLMYDALRLKPNYTVNPVHVEDIYNLEKTFFGINTEGARLTLNEYWRHNGNSFLDILTGFFYINWVPIPFGFAFFLFFKNHRRLALDFAFGFFIINIIGFCIYYAYPAAPPWYVEQYGFKVLHNTGSSAAGLLNFDTIFDIKMFENLYQKNSNVFAAMPSMHSAFPLLCFLIGLSLKKRLVNIFFGIFALGIWFSAVYTRHHYVADVLAGITVACIGFYSYVFLKEKTFLKTWFEKLVQIVS